jgi:serine/threonine-protein kinase
VPRICPTCGLRYPVEFNICPKDGATLTDAKADEVKDEFVGTTLAQTYAITRVIGEGGMGRVYEARHTRIAGKRFALKMLHPEFARQPEVLSRFQREAESAASIKNAHVIDVYDVDRTPDGRPYMVGELLEGTELADFLQKLGEPLPVARAVRITRQICKALAAAHEKGIVHRDMKPENVFLTGEVERPHAKVIDFGISKAGDAPGTALTKTGMIMGTPSYMAPEQAKGDRVDHRVDIYATGAILYCCLTGKRPFDRNDPTATLAAVLTEEPQRPRELNPQIPERLELVIQRAMSKDPKERYQRIADLEAELAEFDLPDTSLATLHAPNMAMAGGKSTMPVELARPTIVLMGGLGMFFVLGAILSVVTGIVRLARGAGAASNLTGFEGAILLSLLTLALSTPALVAALHVKKTIWANSNRAVQLAEALQRTVVGALVTYGAASLFVRVLEAVVLRRAAGVAWPAWDVLLAAAALVAGGASLMTILGERKRRA